MAYGNERIHALDSLRAVMMLLGLVIHTAITYATTEFGDAWRIKDTASTHAIFDIAVFFIHSFRMPTFFAVAGFFAALLFFSRAPSKMLKNRFMRIILPFWVFLPLIWPINYFAWTYTLAVMENSATPFANALSTILNPSTYLPSNTIHLWFLYYLGFYSLAGFGLGLLQKRYAKSSSKLQNYFSKSLEAGLLAPLLFSGITFVLLIILNSPWPEKHGSFIPNPKAIVNYFVFYLFGWLLYSSKHLLPNIAKHAWPAFTIGLLAFCLRAVFNILQQEPPLLVMALNALTAWFLIYGVTGLFIRYFNRRSNIKRQVSDASYWIYLIHLPFTAFLPGLLMQFNWPTGLKFLVVLSCSAFICWISYLWLVRTTLIGAFLNGRKTPR